MRPSLATLFTGGSAVAAALLIATPASAQSASVGLSTVRAQRFGNEDLLGFYTPQSGDLFASSLASGDFDGDGADDLATGIPLDNGIAGSDVVDSGTVIVRYGTPGSGLSTNLASTVLRQTAARDPAEAGDQYGSALVACDFNGDDIDDLAVGIRGENHLGYTDAGAVQVHYGSSSGIHTSGDAFYTESTPGIPGDVEDDDRFGEALACGDFDADGFGDLVIGVPNEGWGAPGSYHPAKGMIVVVPGSLIGLLPQDATSLDQDSPGMNGGADAGDWFGWALAAGDFDADGFDDLAIGVPGEDALEGQIQVVFGGTSGLTSAGNLFWSETAIGGLSESGDFMAWSLAAADFDGDGFDDLAIGIPYESLGSGNSIQETGQLDVLFGAPGGFDRNRTQFWEQDNVLGPGSNEAYDYFAWTLAAGDFDRDGLADLAIGAFQEDVSGSDDGAVTVMMGSAAGLTPARHRFLAAGYEGFPGDPLQHQKDFGLALASGDFDGDGHADLVIGSPYENENGRADVGAETVLYGALFADGAETASTSRWSQTVSSLYFNRVQASGAAKLGPAASRYGLQVDLFAPSVRRPATPAYVRVGPEAGFRDERTLKGTFFIDPQAVTMGAGPPNPAVNAFQLMAFTDSIGSGSKTRLAFDLNLNTAAGGWAINAFHWNDALGALQFSGGALFALPNDASFHNNRIDFEWRAGIPGHLTMWRTRYVGGVPDGNGRILMFDVDLPGAQSSVVNDVLVGMVSGQDPGTYGSLYLDELSFRR